MLQFIFYFGLGSLIGIVLRTIVQLLLPFILNTKNNIQENGLKEIGFIAATIVCIILVFLIWNSVISLYNYTNITLQESMQQLESTIQTE